jgi:multiple sugar transport system substrate-binding protein
MKRTRMLAATAAAAVALSACQAGTPAAPSGAAGTPASAAPVSAQPTTGEAVTLRFLAGFTGGDRPAYEAIVASFNESHPDIQVEMEIQPWDTIVQELPAGIATGSGPDLVTPHFSEGSIFEYAKTGAILPLDDAYGSGEGKIDRDAIPQAAIDAFTYEGKLYAAPANFATLLLYHNLELLEAEGLSGPPETMEELRDYAVKLTKKDANGDVSQYGLVLADHATIPMWPILIWAEGGEIVGDDGCSALADPKTVAAVETWADLVVNENISPVGLTGADADNLFAAGEAAMEMNGPWATGAYTPAGIDYDVAPIPTGEGGEVTLASTVPIVVTKNTEHPEAAFEFLAYWTSQEAQRALALGSGFPPARTDMAEDEQLAAHDWVPKFAAAAPHARVYLAGVEEFAQVDSDVFIPAIQRITRGEAAADVLAEAAEQMDEVLGC